MCARETNGVISSAYQGVIQRGGIPSHEGGISSQVGEISLQQGGISSHVGEI
jgi:hypothetical protein